jgi:aminoglycoside/choline kinase family phosphotransferase
MVQQELHFSHLHFYDFSVFFIFYNQTNYLKSHVNYFTEISMPESPVKKNLLLLFKNWSQEEVIQFTKLPLSGSDRIYYRISGINKKAIGVLNNNPKENSAFLAFSRHFLNQGLNVPQIYAQDMTNNIYLIQDLGDQSLFSYLSEKRTNNDFPEDAIHYYRKTIRQLPRFQITASKGFDFSLCYPRSGFDKQSMMWDLNYFKYYFLKPAKIPFDEQLLEDDFQTFTNFLLKAPAGYFLYRDFQSRNIMILGKEVYFIDYQGGRKGPLQYDIASLLYDAKANIPDIIRNQLLTEYIEQVSGYITLNKNEFMQFYHGFVFIRIMQALGAYGFRGFYERKAHFLQSVPFAVKNIETLLQTVQLPVKIPVLTQIWNQIVENNSLRQISEKQLNLTIHIRSFSYKNGIPADDTGNGGGYVFDCRYLPNPGRLAEYSDQNGYDQPVIDFLEKDKTVLNFMDHIKSLIVATVKNYQERNFTQLQICFGCTGGQHRSVYCANTLAAFLKSNFEVSITLQHIEQNIFEKF